MGKDDSKGRFGSRERGTKNRLRAEEDPEERRRRYLAELDVVLSQMAFPDYSGDVMMLIAQAESTQNHSLQKVDFPRVRKRAAERLLAIHAELLRIAETAPRDASGVLLRPNGMGDLVPWTNAGPRSVAEIPVFAPDNILQWNLIASTPIPPLDEPPPPPSRVLTAKPPAPPATKERPWKLRPREIDPRFLPGGFTDDDIYVGLGLQRPKPVPSRPDPDADRVFIQLIKVPGMSYLTEVGRTQIYAAAIRALLRQEITEARAREIVASVVELKDTITATSADVFETFEVGLVFLIKLHPSFFEKLRAVKEFETFDHKAFRQRTQLRHSSALYEVFPDLSTAERVFFGTRQLVSWMGPDKGVKGFSLIPGKTYEGGRIFIGFLCTEDAPSRLEPTWLTLDGRIGITVEREELLEAYRQGVLAAEGAVIIACAEVAIAAAILLAPAAIAAGAEAGGAAIASVGARVGAATTAAEMGAWNAARWFATSRLGIALGGQGALLWLGRNWERVYSVEEALRSLGTRIGEQGLKPFLKSLVSGEPEDIVQAWAALLHDLGGGYAGYRSGTSSGGAHDDPDPTPAAPGQTAPIKPVQGTPRLVPTPEPEVATPMIVKPTTVSTPASQSTTGKSGGSMTSWLLPKEPPNDNASRSATPSNGVTTPPTTTTARATPRPTAQSRNTTPSTYANDYAEQAAPVVVKQTADGAVVVPVDRSGQAGALDATSGPGSKGAGPTGTSKVTTTTTGARPPGGGGGGGAGGKGGSTGKGGATRPALKVVTDEDEANAKAAKAKQSGTSSTAAPGEDERKTDGKAAAEKGRGAGGATQGVTPRPTVPPGTGRGTGPAPARRAQLPQRVIDRYKLTPSEVEVIETAIDTWRAEMGKRMKQDPYEGANAAHAATQAQLKKQFPSVVAEEPTGITNKGPKSDKQLKSSDVQVNRTGGNSKDPKDHIAAVIELKRTAAIPSSRGPKDDKKGQLAVKGRELGEDGPIDNSQTDAYTVLTTEYGIPVFTVNHKGDVFMPTSQGTWIKIIDGDKGGE